MLYARVLVLSFITLYFIGNISAQRQSAQLHIGSKVIHFDLMEEVEVWRTVHDSVIKCKGLKKYPLGKETRLITLPISEMLIMKREIFNDNGCVWTRLTNDELNKNAINYTQVTFLFDSVNTIINPKACWRHDTIIQINPITLEEEWVMGIDSDMTVKFDLGCMNKNDLIEAIQNQLALPSNNLNFHLKTIDWYILTDKCEGLSIDYRDKESLKLAVEKIKGIKTGAKIVLAHFSLEDTNGRRFPLTTYDVAVMSLKD